MVLDLRGFSVNKVYAVWRGTYSDRDVIAVFSTQALADAFCEEYNKGRYDDAGVQVYEVDSKKDYKRIRYFSTCILYDTGELCDRNQGYTDTGIDKKYVSYSRGLSNELEPNYIQVYSDQSADHADKLAIEARQEYQRLVSQGMSYPDINQLWMTNGGVKTH
jgi:hypothetical protein